MCVLVVRLENITESANRPLMPTAPSCQQHSAPQGHQPADTTAAPADATAAMYSPRMLLWRPSAMLAVYVGFSETDQRTRIYKVMPSLRTQLTLAGVRSHNSAVQCSAHTIVQCGDTTVQCGAVLTQ